MATLKACVIDPDNGVGTTYTSLNAAETANFAATGTDLVSNDEYCVATCKCTGGTADTTATIIAGQGTNATHTITVTVNATYKYTGTWPASGNYYRINAGANDGIHIQTAYVTILNVPIRLSGTPAGNMNAVYVDNVTGCTVQNCLAVNAVTGSTKVMRGFYANLATDNVVYFGNNAVYDFTGNSADDVAFQCAGSGTLYAYNNTMADSTYGMRRVNGALVAKNSIAWNNTADYSGNFSPLSTHNGYKTGSSGPAGGSNGIALGTDATVLFANYAGNNFKLRDFAACPAYRVGTSLAADPYYAITDDVDGDSRHATTPCLGWDEETVGVSRATGRIATKKPTLAGHVSIQYNPIGRIRTKAPTVVGVCVRHIHRHAPGSLTTKAPAVDGTVKVGWHAPGTVTTGVATLAGAVGLESHAAGALTLPAATMDGKAQVEWRAAGALSTAPATLAGKAQVEWRATGAVSTAVPTLAGVAFETWDATAALEIAPISAAGTVKVAWGVTGSLSIGAVTLAGGTAKVGWHATGAVSSAPAIASASVPLEGHAMGSFSTGAATVHGVAFCRWMTVGRLTTKKPTMRGLAQQENRAHGHMTVHAAHVHGHVKVGWHAPAAIRVHAAHVHGHGTREKLFGGPVRVIARLTPARWRSGNGRRAVARSGGRR